MGARPSPRAEGERDRPVVPFFASRAPPSEARERPERQPALRSERLCSGAVSAPESTAGVLDTHRRESVTAPQPMSRDSSYLADGAAHDNAHAS